MKLETTEKPSLESLGLVCSITANGVEKMNNDEQPMCAWICTFTNQRGRSENFDYYTGYGCGPEISESELQNKWPLVANVPKQNRSNISDKYLLCRIAHHAAFKAKWTPDPIEVLWVIARDGEACELTFEDWASELGYNTDSRKAEKIYRACQDSFNRLRKIVPIKAIETLKSMEM